MMSPSRLTRRAVVEFQTVLKRRRMVRAFESRPVPPEVLDPILRNVLHAPSAGFTQGNEFLVLDDPDRLDAFWRITDMPDEPETEEERAVRPPILILPLANQQSYTGRYSAPDKIRYGLDKPEAWPAPYWDIDAGMAALLVLLSSVDAGLGAYFFGIAHGEQELRREFKIPDQFRPIGVIGLGYPAPHDPWLARSSAARLARRPIEVLIHRNGW
jgi:nitroreductase